MSDLTTQLQLLQSAADEMRQLIKKKEEEDFRKFVAAQDRIAELERFSAWCSKNASDAK